MIKDFKKLLGQFVAIPSVSTDTAYKKNINQVVAWLISYAKKSGLSTKIVRGYGNPIIMARTKEDTSKKTILVYGHYDVQPAQKEDGWKSDPFVLTERQGRLYGRGSADNKGQILTHVFSVTKLMKEKNLGFNIIFLVEGDEETGSGDFAKFLKKYKQELICDCVLISDGDLAPGNAPALEASFRGSANLELSLSVARDDVHSGLFGGIAPNAGEVLAQVISRFSDKERKIFGGEGHSIEVTSIVAGYQGVGFRNSIPARALCKVNIRSKGDSDPEKLIRDFEKYIRGIIPTYATLTIQRDRFARGAYLSLDNAFSTRAKVILESVYKKKVVTVQCGATLPIITDFTTTLKVPMVCVPLANTDCGMHSASENISIKSIERGLAFSQSFFGMDN